MSGKKINTGKQQDEIEVEEKKAPKQKPVNVEKADEIAKTKGKLSKIIREAKLSNNTDGSIAKKENIETAMDVMAQFKEIGKDKINEAKYIDNIRIKLNVLLKDTGVSYANFTLRDVNNTEKIVTDDRKWLDEEWINPGDKSFLVSGPGVKKGKTDESKSKSRYNISKENKGELVDARVQKHEYVEPEYGPRDEEELMKKLQSGNITSDELEKLMTNKKTRSDPSESRMMGFQKGQIRTVGKEREKDKEDIRINDLAWKKMKGENPSMSMADSIRVGYRIKDIENESLEKSEKRDIYGRIMGEDEKKSTKSKKPETAEDKEIREQLDYNKEEWERVKKGFIQKTGYHPISGKDMDEEFNKRFTREREQEMDEDMKKHRENIQASLERQHSLNVNKEREGASTPIKSISTKEGGLTEDHIKYVRKKLNEYDDEMAARRGEKMNINFNEKEGDNRKEDDRMKKMSKHLKRTKNLSNTNYRESKMSDTDKDRINRKQNNFDNLQEELKKQNDKLGNKKNITKKDLDEQNELYAQIDRAMDLLKNEGITVVSIPQISLSKNKFVEEKKSGYVKEKSHIELALEEKAKQREKPKVESKSRFVRKRDKLYTLIDTIKEGRKYLKKDITDEELNEAKKKIKELQDRATELTNDHDLGYYDIENNKLSDIKPLTDPQEGKYQSSRAQPSDKEIEDEPQPSAPPMEPNNDFSDERKQQRLIDRYRKELDRQSEEKYKPSAPPMEPNNDFFDNRPVRLERDDDTKHNYLPPQKYYTNMRYDDINAFEKEIEEKKQYQQQRNQMEQDERNYDEQLDDDRKDARNIAPDIVEEKQGTFMRNLNQFNNYFEKAKKDGFFRENPKNPKRGDNINSRSEDDQYSRFLNDSSASRRDENKSHFVNGISEYMRANNIRNRVKLNDLGYDAMRGLAEDVGIVGAKSDSWSDKYGVNLDLFEELREIGAVDPILNHPKVRNTSAGRALAELNEQTKGGDTNRPGKLANMGMKFVDIMKAAAVPFRIYAGDIDAAGQLGDLRKGYMAGKSIWQGGKEVYKAAKNENTEEPIGPESEKSELAEILKKLGNIKDDDKGKGGRYPEMKKIANQFRFPNSSEVRNAVPLISNAITGYMNSMNEYGSFYDDTI